MIDYGQRVNPNRQQVQSLGAIATGDVHTFTRYRTGGDGSSLHPAQREGRVSSAASMMQVRQTAAGPPGLGSSERAPAAQTSDPFPPVLQYVGSPRDPRFQV